MNNGEDTLVLDSEADFVKFTKLLSRAVAEGRIDGRYRCPVCGMRFNNEPESIICCAPMARSA